MNKLLVLGFLIGLGWKAWSHEPNEAYFHLTLHEDEVWVKAEFPWTLRNAMLLHDPRLDSATTKAEFEAAFAHYVQEHLILTGADGAVFQWLGFEEMAHAGHSHQSTYVLRFRGKDLQSIQNTLMFELYPEQVNNHTVEADPEASFSTNAAQPEYRFPVQNTTIWFVGSLLMAGAVLLAWMIYRRRLERTKGSRAA